ncbi:MAG: hypothetical protein KGD65_07790 [Candidatus Lokiarchaeota archaeon]|nr:hypothetical protein [Candidatus Lokiarchaeota archaeon]
MKDEEIILGLFFADEDNLVYENIKCLGSLSEETKNDLKMLSFKFLGPVFLTAASGIENNWVIELIESSLSLSDTEVNSADVIQSFFTLNSSMITLEGSTNLFTLISTPFTEDIKLIYDEISEYIHPSILQGKIVNENLLGSRFNFDRFIQKELYRGLNLIEYSLGASRKVYWEERQQYYCVGVIERKNADDLRVSNLYTFDRNDPLRKKYLDFIPSYYVMSILPDYYEHLISETLNLFDKKGVSPNIRLIKLRYENKRVVYLEEYILENSIFKSYGAILVQKNELSEESHNLSYYRKILRTILSSKKNLRDVIKTVNPRFEDARWGTILDEELNQIANILDNDDEVETRVF